MLCMFNAALEHRQDSSEARIDPSAIREELARIVASASFTHSPRMRRFLTYVVEETLAGRGTQLKEYTIGLSVYDKPADFDPRTDSIIRVEANRLRGKLEKYYSQDGQKDAVAIRLSKNTYVPRFCRPREIAISFAKSEWEIEYLRAKHFLARRDPDALYEAIRWFTAAATRQPAFSMAMAGLADCYTWIACLEFSEPEQVWSQATLCARRALAETPPYRRALTNLACEAAMHRWDWAAAERQFQEVIEFDPAYVPAYQMYAVFCLAPQSRFDEGLYYLQQARELEPNSAITACYSGRILYLGRKYAEAVRALQHSIRLDPKLLPAYWQLGFTYAQLEEWDHATAALAAAVEIFNEPLAVAALGYIRGVSGAQDAALQARERLREFSRTRYVSPISFALVEIALGNNDGAFDLLHGAVKTRAARLIHLPTDPAFDSIKTDPRFVHLLSHLGL